MQRNVAVTIRTNLVVAVRQHNMDLSFEVEMMSSVPSPTACYLSDKVSSFEEQLFLSLSVYLRNIWNVVSMLH